MERALSQLFLRNGRLIRDNTLPRCWQAFYNTSIFLINWSVLEVCKTRLVESIPFTDFAKIERMPLLVEGFLKRVDILSNIIVRLAKGFK